MYISPELESTTYITRPILEGVEDHWHLFFFSFLRQSEAAEQHPCVLILNESHTVARLNFITHISTRT